MEQQPLLPFDAPPPAPPPGPPPEPPARPTAAPRRGGARGAPAAAAAGVHRVSPGAWGSEDLRAVADGLRRLAAGVVLQAVKDLRAVGDADPGDRASAERFLLAEGDPAFRFWCGVLGADPDRVRQAAGGLLAAAAAETAGRASRPTPAA